MFKITKDVNGKDVLGLFCDVCDKPFFRSEYSKGEICIFPDMFERQLFAHKSCASGKSDKIRNIDEFTNGSIFYVYTRAVKGVDDESLLVDIKRVLNKKLSKKELQVLRELIKEKSIEGG